MPIILANSFIKVTYHPDQRLIENTGLVTPHGPEFRTGCDRVLQLAHELKPRLWLSDNRLMGSLHADDLTWLAEDFMPRFAKLPVSRAAVVHSAETMDQLAMAGMLDDASEHMSWQERSFTVYDDAWQWLMRGASTDQAFWALTQG